jgi:hypothetical protein
VDRTSVAIAINSQNTPGLIFASKKDIVVLVQIIIGKFYLE